MELDAQEHDLEMIYGLDDEWIVVFYRKNAWQPDEIDRIID